MLSALLLESQFLHLLFFAIDTNLNKKHSDTKHWGLLNFQNKLYFYNNIRTLKLNYLRLIKY